MQITRTHLRVAVLLLLAAISFAGCGNRAAREEESAKKPAGRPTIVFMTDFGTANDAVAICGASGCGRGVDISRADRGHPGAADARDVIGLDDPFGSLITDIQGDDFKKLGYSLREKVPVKIEQKLYSFPYGKTFMDVPVGEPLLARHCRAERLREIFAWHVLARDIF
jgi:hypothetical protein